MDIFVGVTAVDGRIHFDTAAALVEEQRRACENGDRLLICSIGGIPYIDRARNVVVNLFMNTPADRMVWLDYDVSWTPGDLVKLAKRPEDFVAGAYRLKQARESYPVGYWPEQKIERNGDGSIECRHVPFGFCKVARSVFLKFQSMTPGRTYTDHIRGVVHMYFQSMYIPGDNGEPGHKIEEDIGFCLEWQMMGGKVYVDPSIPLTHHFGMVPFPGNYGRWLDNDIANSGERRPGPANGSSDDGRSRPINTGPPAVVGASKG